MMNLRAFMAYMSKSKEYGWSASWEGARAFKEQIKKGLRDSNNFNWKLNK